MRGLVARGWTAAISKVLKVTGVTEASKERQVRKGRRAIKEKRVTRVPG